MINRIAIDKHGWQLLSQCLSKSHTSYHTIFITTCAQDVRLQLECNQVDADASHQQHIQ